MHVNQMEALKLVRTCLRQLLLRLIRTLAKAEASERGNWGKRELGGLKAVRYLPIARISSSRQRHSRRVVNTEGMTLCTYLPTNHGVRRR